jgi:MoaA/NifB/PqqE/SkfB family radical SAM enzyme
MLEKDNLRLDQTENYSGSEYTRSIGADLIKQKLYARHGERYMEYRENWARAEALELQPFPLNLLFDLIDGCNLACPQCLRSLDIIGDYEGHLNTRSRLSYEDVEAALDEGYQHGLPSVNIGGSGEGMLHPDFLKICQAVMDRDVMEYRIATNGLRLNRDTAEALIDMQVQMVSVSIDAFSPETFGKTRGKPHRYQQVVDNTLALLKLRQERGSIFPLVRVSFVNQPANRHELQDFENFWSQHVDMVDIQGFHDFRSTDYNYDFDCMEPWIRMTLWADGHVGPCCGFPGIVLDIGSVRETKLKEIWHGPKMQAIRQQLLDRKYDIACLKCMGVRSSDV